MAAKYYQQDLLKEDDELWRMHDKLDKEQVELVKGLADWQKDAAKSMDGWILCKQSKRSSDLGKRFSFARSKATST